MLHTIRASTIYIMLFSKRSRSIHRVEFASERSKKAKEP